MGSGASAITKEDFDARAQGYWSRFADEDTSTITPRRAKKCLRALRVANFTATDLADFQQPINCCNITSLAFAFSVIKPSNPVSVNDIFHKARLPGWWVTWDGMTLAETFNVAAKMVAQLGGLFVECYHFDPEFVTYEGFKEMLLSAGEELDDVLIANFSVRIAHQWDHGGGHFALVGLAEKQEGSDDIRVTMSEVHPLKYGKSWTCSSRHLFDAMVDKDGDAKRARGLIRIGTASAERRPKFLAAAQKSVCYCDPALPQAESAWLARFSANLPVDKFQMVLNLGGVTAAALALSVLIPRGDFSIVEPDDIMRGLSLNYVPTLNKVSTAAEVESIINDFSHRVAKSPVTARQVPVGADADAMLKALHAATGPADGGRVVVLLTDLNVVMGTTLIHVDPNSEAANLSHSAAHWCLAVCADVSARTVTIADPRSKITTRLWKASAGDLFAGLQARKSATMVAVESKI